MRIAALALVLIVASAVVLIFANTLNSWVLGGLIGGLAALLISIPISLIIFSALARRQDEHLHAQMLAQHEEDMAYDEYDEYNEYAEVYEAEAYVLPSEDEQFEQMRGRRQPEVRGLPAAGQSYASANQRPLNNPQGYRKPTRDLPAAQERNRGASAQRQGQQTGHQRQPRSPYTTRSLRSQQHAAALRAARQEAEQEHSGSQHLSTGPVRRPATTRHLPPQSIQFHRSHLHDEMHKTEKTQPTNTRRTNANSDTSNRNKPPRTDDLRPREMQTDQLRGHNPVTGPVRLNPETGKIVRNPQLGEYSGESKSGSLRNPLVRRALVRRAPYMYEDDPLREELAQHVEKPITRRSSLYHSYGSEED